MAKNKTTTNRTRSSAARKRKSLRSGSGSSTKKTKTVSSRKTQSGQSGPTLASKHRAVARQWHPKKNGDLTPKDVKPASRKKVWWQCPEGHEWQAVVYSRTLNNTGCPYCSGKKAGKDNCLSTLFPKIAKEWHPEKNGSLTPKDVTKGSKKRVWWQCTQGHEWQAPVYDRTNGKGCPYCAHRALGDDNNLAALNPGVAKEWHPTKNRSLKPNDVFPAAGVKVWWRCSHGHEWQATVNSRTTLGTGCPYCSGRKIAKERSLATLHRGIAREWDKDANGDLTPKDVSELSKKTVTWKCRKGHTWEASVRSRTQTGSGCPVCESERKTTSGSKRSTGSKKPQTAKKSSTKRTPSDQKTQTRKTQSGGQQTSKKSSTKKQTSSKKANSTKTSRKKASTKKS